jgi:hypothetical protein
MVSRSGIWKNEAIFRRGCREVSNGVALAGIWKNEATVRAAPESVADCRTGDSNSKNEASLRKWPRRVSRNVETAAQSGSMQNKSVP